MQVIDERPARPALRVATQPPARGYRRLEAVLQAAAGETLACTDVLAPHTAWRDRLEALVGAWALGTIAPTGPVADALLRPWPEVGMLRGLLLLPSISTVRRRVGGGIRCPFGATTWAVVQAGWRAQAMPAPGALPALPITTLLATTLFGQAWDDLDHAAQRTVLEASLLLSEPPGRDDRRWATLLLLATLHAPARVPHLLGARAPWQAAWHAALTT